MDKQLFVLEEEVWNGLRRWNASDVGLECLPEIDLLLIEAKLPGTLEVNVAMDRAVTVLLLDVRLAVMAM